MPDTSDPPAPEPSEDSDPPHQPWVPEDGGGADAPDTPPSPVLGLNSGSDPPKPTRSLLLGIGAANGVAAVLMGLSRWLVAVNNDTSGVLVLSNFIVVPLLMGIVSAFFWRNLKHSILQVFLFALLNTAIGIAMSALFLREGTICLIIVSPLVLTFVFCGGLLGRLMFQPRHNTLRLSVLPLLLVFMVADCLQRHEHHNEVVTRMRIAAPPERVWPHVVSFVPIQAEPDYWLFRLGLPRPAFTSAEGPFVGARRECVFSGNLVFGERIVELEPNRRITFEILSQPPHPEILGHATLRQGQMTLQDNGDGTTTLIGRSRYSLHVYPAWYYDLWAESIGHSVHASVFRHIRSLAESRD